MSRSPMIGLSDYQFIDHPIIDRDDPMTDPDEQM
jgi:hypothetical protein